MDKIKAEDLHKILGTQAQLWTEYIQTPSRVEYMAYPRMFAMAELSWLPKEKKNFDDFLKRVKVATKRLDIQGINYRKFE